MGWATTRHRGLQDRVEKVLGSLGGDPAQIARRLEEAGVRGTPLEQEGCAIAVYLSAVVGADPEVGGLRVGPKHVVISSSRWYRHRVTVRLSSPLQEFIARFDAGCYPRLTWAYQDRGERDQEPHQSPP
jgi:hypothetical protein